MSRLVFVPWLVFDKAWEVVESLFMPLRKEEKLLSNKRTEKSSSKIIIGYFLFSNCFFRSSSTSLRWVTLASRLQRLKEKKSRFSLEALSSMELEVKSRWIWSTRLEIGYLTSWNKRILLIGALRSILSASSRRDLNPCLKFRIFKRRTSFLFRTGNFGTWVSCSTTWAATTLPRLGGCYPIFENVFRWEVGALSKSASCRSTFWRLWLQRCE